MPISLYPHRMMLVEYAKEMDPLAWDVTASFTD
jgi:hypothetical protein